MSRLSGIFRPARQVLGELTGDACTIDGMAGTFYPTFGEESPSMSLGDHGTDEQIEVPARFSKSEFLQAPPFGATLTREGVRYKIGVSGNGANSWTTTLHRLDRSTAPAGGDPFPV